jgi:hypothetical protein
VQIGMSRRPGSSYIATSIECILKHSHRSWASPRGSPLLTASSTAAPHSPALKLSSIFRDVDYSMWLDVSWKTRQLVPRLVTTENETSFRLQVRIVRIDFDLENQA